MPILSGEVVTATRLNRLKPTTYYAVATGNLVGPQTDTDVPGATITLTTETDSAVCSIWATCGYTWTANTTISTCEVWQGSTPLPGKIYVDPDNTTGRSTNGNAWRVAPGAAGSYTFKIVGESIQTNMTIDLTHTTILVAVYENV